jgi:hypothetical protein
MEAAIHWAGHRRETTIGTSKVPPAAIQALGRAQQEKSYLRCMSPIRRRRLRPCVRSRARQAPDDERDRDPHEDRLRRENPRICTRRYQEEPHHALKEHRAGAQSDSWLASGDDTTRTSQSSAIRRGTRRESECTASLTESSSVGPINRRIQLRLERGNNPTTNRVFDEHHRVVAITDCVGSCASPPALKRCPLSGLPAVAFRQDNELAVAQTNAPARQAVRVSRRS